MAPVVGVRGREGKGGKDILKTCSEYVKFIRVYVFDCYGLFLLFINKCIFVFLFSDV